MVKMVYTLASGVGGAVEQLTRRKLVTIDGSKVTSETAIPLVLNINLPGVKAAGADVRLAKLDGTPIAREIECKDVPNTDDVTIHFPFDTIAGTDSQFYVYWAPGSALTEPAADSTYGSHAVWDANYISVWHMNDDPSDSAPQIIDSTSNLHDGTVYTTMVSGDLIDTAYGKGITFESSKSEAIRIQDDALSGLNYCTLEFDVDISTHDATALISSTWALPHPIYIEWDFVDTSKIVFDQGILHSTANNYDLTGHHHITYIKSGTSWLLYIDGTYQESVTSGDYPAIDTTSGHEYSLFKFTGVERSFLNGIARGVKLSNVAKSTNYITTAHNNLNNPTAAGTTPFFKSFGFEQHQRRTPQFM